MTRAAIVANVRSAATTPDAFTLRASGGHLFQRVDHAD
jgi:hypothetical protein